NSFDAYVPIVFSAKRDLPGVSGINYPNQLFVGFHHRMDWLTNILRVTGKRRKQSQTSRLSFSNNRKIRRALRAAYLRFDRTEETRNLSSARRLGRSVGVQNKP